MLKIHRDGKNHKRNFEKWDKSRIATALADLSREKIRMNQNGDCYEFSAKKAKLTSERPQSVTSHHCNCTSGTKLKTGQAKSGLFFQWTHDGLCGSCNLNSQNLQLKCVSKGCEKSKENSISIMDKVCRTNKSSLPSSISSSSSSSSSKNENGCNVPFPSRRSDKEVKDQQEAAKYYLKMKKDGWILDLDGKWVKDENCEFDSDDGDGDGN